MGQEIERDDLLGRLVDLNYERNDVDFTQGTFRVRGDTLEIYPMYARYALRVEFWGDEIDRMLKVDPLEGEVKSEEPAALLHPAEHYSIPEQRLQRAIDEIKELLDQRISYFERQGDHVAAQRIEERTTFDIEMMQETGYCSGIENYSVHLSDRETGEAPYTLLDYFPDDFLTVVDESHQTLPQIRGQFEGDKSRKESLVENGFRLPTAFDNRPLTFEEFEEKTDQTLYVSATPGDYEREHSDQVVEQIVRPTHLVDPAVEIASATGQVEDLLERIDERVERDERVLVTTLTKRMAEDLTEYLEESGVNVAYMHDETDTLERHELIRSLRLGDIDVLVGINLLREGLDIPEVSLVAILDATRRGSSGRRRRWYRRWAGPPGTSTARSCCTPTSAATPCSRPSRRPSAAGASSSSTTRNTASSRRLSRRKSAKRTCRGARPTPAAFPATARATPTRPPAR